MYEISRTIYKKVREQINYISNNRMPRLEKRGILFWILEERRMKESVALAKEVDAKKRVSHTSSDKIIHRARNEPVRQLGSLRSVINNIRHDGGTPSVDSIATEMSGMPTTQRADVLLALQRTHGNRYVQRVVAGIQAKLVVGQPGDVYEQEADRVADAVMRMPEPQVQRQVEEDEEEIIPTKGYTGQTHEVTHDLESQIPIIRGGGQHLPKSVRVFFEPRFGYDFSQVRVHTDAKAGESTRAVNALAYTVGRDMVFGAGQYAPETNQGRKLLAHELAHVVQQGGAAASMAPMHADDAGYDTLKEDADKTAIGHVPIQRGVKEGMNDNSQNTMLRQRSGLRLQRFWWMMGCGGSSVCNESTDLPFSEERKTVPGSSVREGQTGFIRSSSAFRHTGGSIRIRANVVSGGSRANYSLQLIKCPDTPMFDPRIIRPHNRSINVDQDLDEGTYYFEIRNSSINPISVTVYATTQQAP